MQGSGFRIRLIMDKILLSAIMFSLILHVFWISVINVSIIPKDTKPVKFSKVSFLGPILDRGVFSVRLEPREKTFLEKRYISGAGNILFTAEEGALSKIHAPKMRDIPSAKTANLSNMIEKALSGPKMEPK